MRISWGASSEAISQVKSVPQSGISPRRVGWQGCRRSNSKRGISCTSSPLTIHLPDYYPGSAAPYPRSPMSDNPFQFKRGAWVAGLLVTATLIAIVGLARRTQPATNTSLPPTPTTRTTPRATPPLMLPSTIAAPAGATVLYECIKSYFFCCCCCACVEGTVRLGAIGTVGVWSVECRWSVELCNVSIFRINYVQYFCWELLRPPHNLS